MMRRFLLVRNEDITGKSGVGIIAEGVTLTGGAAFLHWLTDYETHVVWPGGLDAILAVHGHEGATIARFIDGEPVGDSRHWSDGTEVDPAELDAQTDNDDEDPLAIFDREDR